MTPDDLRARLTSTGIAVNVCSVCQILDRIDPALAAVVREAIADRGVRVKQIEAVLTELHPPGAGRQAVAKHRRDHHDA